MNKFAEYSKSKWYQKTSEYFHLRAFVHFRGLSGYCYNDHNEGKKCDVDAISKLQVQSG